MTPGRGEEGYGAVELVAGVAVLLVPVALLVMAFPSWSAMHSMARVAAQEAARAAIGAETQDPERAAAAGRDAARQVAANHGVDPDDVEVGFPRLDLGRGGAVEALVGFTVPAVVLPGFGPAGSFSREVRHAEAVDLYRSVE